MEEEKEVSFTGSFKLDGDFNYFFKNENEKDFEAFSKKYDLWKFLTEDVRVEWILENWKIEVKEIKIIERQIKEKEDFFYENKEWGYGFFVETKNYYLIEWGSRTLVKNNSGEVVLSFFPVQSLPSWAFFSNEGEARQINWNPAEVVEDEGKVKLVVKNRKQNYWVKISWEKNKKDSEKIIRKVIETFSFAERVENKKIYCGWKEKLECPSGYICDLYSLERDSDWICKEL